MQSFDLIVIGTGSAGKTVAETVREAGKSVAIIDKLPFGGTCSQRGCDPKKVLVGAAEIVARSAQLTGRGITNTATINWADLIQFKKTFTDSIPEKTEKKFTDQGIQLFHGAATFLSATTIRVGDEELSANHIVIATGQRPQTLNIPGEELLIDSTRFMELAELPNEIVTVGGGYIAFEFAHIAARAGAKVTILHQGKQPLEGFDADLVDLLVKAMRAIGIFIVLEAKVTEVEKTPARLMVHYEHGGESYSAEADLVVHAAGRVADVAEMALDAAGVAIGKKGVMVNEYLQSASNPAVYACGDVADKGLPLTPLASYEGSIVAHNILNGNQRTYTNDPVPTTVFTGPPLASIGLTEEQARQQGLPVKVMFQETADWYVSRRINEPITGFKTLVDAETDQIVGAHLLGSGSEDVINLFAMAMKHKIPAKALGAMLFAYPTHASDINSMLP
ncbi:dihydrolipoyl dehydrogenase family protein [Spirosoma endbachense]|uniref:NAD(P)/FAD-dependent oxidoreductase n=1 Tax=Spirosoma endbachense TaxID=2666025 RepID=A0A6P1W3I5_9BACT|nr:NAD(P)/FAD-dependent oxidoreductase [Spirosoma endbachense]QHW00002.1 NAD(P)/FAD-dependent oxidoreductase [Spirosoma endbachense]